VIFTGYSWCGICIAAAHVDLPLSPEAAMLASMAVVDLPDLSDLAPDTIRPICVDEYMQLVEAGAFEDEKVELLAGVVVAMSSQGDEHKDFVVLMNRLLARRLTDDFMVAPQCTYRLSRYSAPEPDFAIITTASMWNRPWRAVWMIEIAYTSQHKDRGIKAQLYAAAGVPEYWVIDAKAMTVDIHRDPSPDGYRSVTQHGELAQLAPQAIPTLVFNLRDLLSDRITL
jgi:Uma2 family endonuclease